MTKKINYLYKEIKQVGQATFIAGLNNSYSGNFSIRIGNYILIKRHGAMMGFLKDSDIIKIKLNGDDPNLKFASTEASVHRAILKNTKAHAVLHTHGPYATVLSLGEKWLFPLNVEGAYYLKKIPVVEFTKATASSEMEQILPEYFKKYNTVIVKGHGLFSVGETLSEALNYSHSAEDASRIIYLSKLIDFDINKLSKADYLKF